MKRFSLVLAFIFVLAGFAAAQEGITGKVIETMNSGGYTYLLLQHGKAKAWVAIPQAKVAKGGTITVAPGVEMVNFQSKTLHRKFSRIIFSGGLMQAGMGYKAPANKAFSMAEGSSSRASAVKTENGVRVQKAAGPNAYTVAEVFAKRAVLDNKPVVIRGKVVKVSMQIMNKNWVHIQDGTSDPSLGGDLVVTTSGQPSVGDVVTVSGTLHKDRDFGAGYIYQAIVENASVKK